MYDVHARTGTHSIPQFEAHALAARFAGLERQDAHDCPVVSAGQRCRRVSLFAPVRKPRPRRRAWAGQEECDQEVKGGRAWVLWGRLQCEG